MNLLIDTVDFLWFISEIRSFPGTAGAIESSENAVFPQCRLNR